MCDDNTTAAITNTAKRLQQFWLDVVENGQPCYLALEHRDGKLLFYMNNAPRAPHKQSHAQHCYTQKKFNTNLKSAWSTAEPNPANKSAQPETIPDAMHISPE